MGICFVSAFLSLLVVQIHEDIWGLEYADLDCCFYSANIWDQLQASQIFKPLLSNVQVLPARKNAQQ